MNQIMFQLGDATKAEFAMAVSERPQQRLEHFGVSALSDTELLALALQGNGLRPEQALDVAARLLATAGSVASLLAWTPGDYRRLPGISATKAAQLAATAELARRIMLGSIPQQPVLNRPELIAAHLGPLAAGLEVYVELMIMWSERAVVAVFGREVGHKHLGIIAL